ncbi:DNA invertase [Vibrio cidicii]|uniref:recombinase family protein n=1 Tax=Vibrio cidicii TaxID=1763883 RepID=UPI0018C2B3CC|nr:recombinase family protein [Vibrio cidicii]MBG0761942.1 DNA invertase [Vibrio cidicii]
MKIGYARVSTDDQDLALQLDALKNHGCERVFEEKVSGRSQKRPILDRMLDTLREGDTVVVWRLDRLGRGLKHLIELMSDFQEKGIQFVSLNEAIDTSTPTGELTFHIFASIAQFERAIISERTKAGLKAARARGRKGGRKPSLSQQDIKKAAAMLLDPSVTKTDVAKHFKVSRPTLDKALKTNGTPQEMSLFQ